MKTVAMTFDNYATTYDNAFFDMNSKGLLGTFFIDADHVGSVGLPIRDNLVLMAAQGWEIGARVYGTIAGAETNMVGIYNYPIPGAGRDVALDRLMAQKVAMHNLGFDIKSIAASQRSWSTQLRGLASHVFENVRVADRINYGTFPIADKLNIRDGGSNSWSAGDTGVKLLEWLDAIPVGSYGIPVIHKVNDPVSADPNYTVSFNEFKIFTAGLASRIAAGTHRAVTIRQLTELV